MSAKIRLNCDGFSYVVRRCHDPYLRDKEGNVIIDKKTKKPTDKLCGHCSVFGGNMKPTPPCEVLGQFSGKDFNFNFKAARAAAEDCIIANNPGGDLAASRLKGAA